MSATVVLPLRATWVMPKRANHQLSTRFATINIHTAQSRTSTAHRRALAGPRAASSSFRGAVAPWLPPVARDDNNSAAAGAARLLVALFTYCALPLQVGVLVHIFWNQAAFAALLGSQLQVLMLMLSALFLTYGYGGAVLQHEYEGFQLAKQQFLNTATNTNKSTNRWLRELTARHYISSIAATFICFAAAAFGLTPTVQAVAAITAIGLAGPYAPVVDIPVQGQPILMVSIWSLLAVVPAMVLFGMALWMLLGASGLLILLYMNVGLGFETVAEVTSNDLMHVLAHALQLSSFPVIVFMLTRTL